MKEYIDYQELNKWVIRQLNHYGKSAEEDGSQYAIGAYNLAQELYDFLLSSGKLRADKGYMREVSAKNRKLKKLKKNITRMYEKYGELAVDIAEFEVQHELQYPDGGLEI